MKNKKRLLIENPIYHYKVVVIYDDVDNLPFGLDIDKYNGTTFLIDGSFNKRGETFFLVVIRDSLDYSIVAHEFLHVVNMTFEKIGIKADNNNDEAQAYYLGFLVKQYQDKLKEKTKINSKNRK